MKFFFNCFFVLSVILQIECFNCLLNECCNDNHVNFNLTKLEKSLQENFCGQPMAKQTVINAIKSHFNIVNPKKALVLSFHGFSGLGKSLLSRLLAESIFLKGIKSKYFIQFNLAKDFPHNSKIKSYKFKLKNIIENAVTECNKAMFVFNGIELAPIGLIDSLKAYVDFNQEIDGVDYRSSVFIFLSNSATKEILSLSFDFKNRFNLNIFQNAIQKSIYSNKGDNEKGLWRSSIIDSYLIDFYIPFFPLNHQEIINCLKNEILKCNIKINNKDLDLIQLAETIAEDLKSSYMIFTSFCKHVYFLIHLNNKKILKEDL